MKYKIKLIVGFRRDQEHSVPLNEAHKAYYLFLHPEQRGVFSNGLAIVGSQIQEIVPDYQGSMGWSPTHTLDSDDWAELNREGLPSLMQKYLGVAKDVAQLGEPKNLNRPLAELVQEKYPTLNAPPVEQRGGGFKKIGKS